MLTYEKAGTEDILPVFQMVRALIEEYEDFDRVNRDKVLQWTYRSIEEHLPFCSRVRQDGQLAGYYFLYSGNEITELDNLFVLPEFRGQGIGTAILKKCIAETETDLILYVFRKNTRAIVLYEKMGFRVKETVSKTRQIMIRKKEGC